MNYKKNILLTFLAAFLIFTYLPTNAQNTYFGINVGYGIPTESSTNGAYNISATPLGHTYERINTGYGGGFNLGAKFGFSINEFFAFEVGANYLLGNTSTITQKYDYPNQSTGITTITASSNMLQISPSIIFSLNNTEAFINPYTRFGITAGFGSIIQNIQWEETFYTPVIFVGSGENTITSKFNGGVALGINAALGANFKIHDRISIFGELNLLSQSYAPKKRTVTKYISNDVDILPDLTTYERETEYYESITTLTSNNFGTPNQFDEEPSKELAITARYSSLGLNIGVKVYLK